MEAPWCPISLRRRITSNRWVSREKLKFSRTTSPPVTVDLVVHSSYYLELCFDSSLWLRVSLLAHLVTKFRGVLQFGSPGNAAPPSDLTVVRHHQLSFLFLFAVSKRWAFLDHNLPHFVSQNLANLHQLDTLWFASCCELERRATMDHPRARSARPCHRWGHGSDHKVRILCVNVGSSLVSCNPLCDPIWLVHEFLFSENWVNFKNSYLSL